MFARLFPHIPQFLIAWSVFFACGLVFYVVRSTRGGRTLSIRNLLADCIPFDIRSNESFHTDLKVYAIDSFTGILFAAPGLILTSAIGVGIEHVLQATLPQKLPHFGLLAATTCALVMFVLAEFSDYAFHYLEHKVPELWELHKVHHAAQVLNPFTARRLHPLSLILNGLARGLISGVPAGLLIHVFGVTIAEAVSLSLAASKIFSVTSLNPLKHSHYPVCFGPFDRLLISPHMHQIHHSRLDAHLDRNFGTNLSVFDWLCGTAHQPRPGEWPDIGIAGCSEAEAEAYNSLRGAYLRPIASSCAMLRDRMASRRLRQLEKRLG